MLYTNNYKYMISKKERGSVSPWPTPACLPNCQNLTSPFKISSFVTSTHFISDSSNTAFWPSLSPSCTATLWTEGSGGSAWNRGFKSKKLKSAPVGNTSPCTVADRSHPMRSLSPPGMLKKRILSNLSFHKCKVLSCHFKKYSDVSSIVYITKPMCTWS